MLEWRQCRVQAFSGEDVHNLVRFHFAKQDDTLNEAIKRLATLKEKRQ